MYLYLFISFISSNVAKIIYFFFQKRNKYPLICNQKKLTLIFRNLTSLFFFTLTHFIGAQSFTLSSSFLGHQQLFSPSYSGTLQNPLISFYQRNFPNNTRINSLSLFTPFSYQRYSIGGTIYSYRSDLLTQTELSIPFTYKINFYKGKLIFGIENRFGTQTIHPKSFRAEHQVDPDYILYNESATQWGYNVHSGITYHSKKFCYTISVRNLLGLKDNKSSGYLNNSAVLFLHGNYRKVFAHNSDLNTTLLIQKHHAQIPLATLINRFSYQQKFGLGIGLRSNSDLIFQGKIDLNFLLKKLPTVDLLYSYDLKLSSSKVDFFYPSHEFLINYPLPQIESKNKVQKRGESIHPIIF